MPKGQEELQAEIKAVLARTGYNQVLAAYIGLGYLLFFLNVSPVLSGIFLVLLLALRWRYLVAGLRDMAGALSSLMAGITLGLFFKALFSIPVYGLEYLALAAVAFIGFGLLVGAAAYSYGTRLLEGTLEPLKVK